MLTIVFHFFIEVVVKYNINTIQNHIFLNHKVQFIAKDILNTKKTLITLIKKLNAEFWKVYLQTKPRERPTEGSNYFQFFRNKTTEANAAIVKSKTSSFAINKPCEIQSNAFDRCPNCVNLSKNIWVNSQFLQSF